ncbi:hypothetical protein BB561_007026, partial [Smittium simulii]
MLTGAQLIASSLKVQGVSVVFGIVGIPVVEIGEACTAAGIRFIAFRNEQAAGYAASAWGYLTGTPGVCLVVSGPGLVNALSGIVNANINKWPLVILGGSCETDLVGYGAFQELDQVGFCKPHTKYSAKPNSPEQIPYIIERGFNHAVNGVPGAVYLDFPADYINAEINTASVARSTQFVTKLVSPLQNAVDSAAQLILSAKAPLIIIGKGSAYAACEDRILELVDLIQAPFLPTPMGKGVISDNHALNASAARSLALASADVIVILGARLNWILGFGRQFNKSAKIIHADVDVNEINSSVPIEVPLVGHLQCTIQMLVQSINRQLKELPAGIYTTNNTDQATAKRKYMEAIATKIAQNKQRALELVKNRNVMPMTYYTAFNEIKPLLPPNVVFISEGANTMDIARSFFEFELPRRRLDAGTYGTMGVGLGYAIAAQIAYPHERVVAVVGDSAFGFSAMEIETAVRNKLPLIIIVINNSGIYFGLSRSQFDGCFHSTPDPNAPDSMVTQSMIPTTALLPEVAYHDLAIALGGSGYCARTPTELNSALTIALQTNSNT